MNGKKYVYPNHKQSYGNCLVFVLLKNANKIPVEYIFII